MPVLRCSTGLRCWNPPTIVIKHASSSVTIETCSQEHLFFLIAVVLVREWNKLNSNGGNRLDRRLVKFEEAVKFAEKQRLRAIDLVPNFAIGGICEVCTGRDQHVVMRRTTLSQGCGPGGRVIKAGNEACLFLQMAKFLEGKYPKVRGMGLKEIFDNFHKGPYLV